MHLHHQRILEERNYQQRSTVVHQYSRIDHVLEICLQARRRCNQLDQLRIHPFDSLADKCLRLQNRSLLTRLEGNTVHVNVELGQASHCQLTTKPDDTDPHEVVSISDPVEQDVACWHVPWKPEVSPVHGLPVGSAA